jgi:HSP20 family molecular chaperone IbpA
VKKLYPKFELEIAMPGLSKENVEVFLSGDILTIRGVKEEEVNPSPEYIVKGLDLDLIERKFKLVEGLGLNKMEANFTNEVLKIIFYTNTEKEEPHRVIEVD